MTSLRATIMALPVADRLEHALCLIDDLTGHPDRHHTALKTAFGLTPSEAKVLCALNAASPHIVPRARLYSALYGYDGSTREKTINMFVLGLRRKLPLKILTYWGDGFSLPVPVALAAAAPPVRGLRLVAEVTAPAPLRQGLWSVAEQAELRHMARNGSDVGAIADELGRSARAVALQMAVHGLLVRTSGAVR